MKVYVDPIGLTSRSMTRIAHALRRHASPGIEVVRRIEDADLVVLQTIGFDAVGRAEECIRRGQSYAVLQLCLASTEYTAASEWYEFWRGARVVASYYNLVDDAMKAGFRFLHMPLGIDEAFTRHADTPNTGERLVITTGYVTGAYAEPIDEVWRAAHLEGVQAVHVGPNDVEGMASKPPGWNSREGITDEALAQLYLRARWVCGMRHKEGFELPAAEGLVCGARPLVFHQLSMYHWYGHLPIYINDLTGDELVDELRAVFRAPYVPVTSNERQVALRRFSWAHVCDAFWSMVASSVEVTT